MTTTKTTPAQTEALRQLALLGGQTQAFNHTNWKAVERAAWGEGSFPKTNFFFYGKDSIAYKAHMRTVRVLIDRGLVAVDKMASESRETAYKISLTEQGRSALR